MEANVTSVILDSRVNCISFVRKNTRGVKLDERRFSDVSHHQFYADFDLNATLAFHFPCFRAHVYGVSYKFRWIVGQTKFKSRARENCGPSSLLGKKFSVYEMDVVGALDIINFL